MTSDEQLLRSERWQLLGVQLIHPFINTHKAAVIYTAQTIKTKAVIKAVQIDHTIVWYTTALFAVQHADITATP